jgi:photosystem II protein
MIASIQFLRGKNETKVPFIKLTKSKNGKTGTATFIFIYPDLFDFCQSSLEFQEINGMYLLWDEKEKKIFSKDLDILFKNGKPFLLKGIFLFKDSQEWFLFLNFINAYSKETGLFFTQNNLK